MRLLHRPLARRHRDDHPVGGLPDQAIWSYGDGNTASALGFYACPFTFRGR